MLKLSIALAAVLFILPAGATEAGWALLRNGGQIVLLRHAIAPGTGDPANFDIENCGTQRNLSDRGRQQARNLGALIAARAAPVGKVLSSRYCRALETARLAFGAEMVEPFPALDSFFAEREREAEQTEAVLEVMREYSGTGNFFLVTHQVNITALTGAVPQQGEAVIVVPTEEGVRVAARIKFD